MAPLAAILPPFNERTHKRTIGGQHRASRSYMAPATIRKNVLKVWSILAIAILAMPTSSSRTGAARGSSQFYRV